jgi:hypothetical protein
MSANSEVAMKVKMNEIGEGCAEKRRYVSNAKC